MAGSKHQLTTIRRAFDILELLWENGSLSVTEVADLLEVHRSTAHGYLRTLEATGFVINEEGHYRVGLRFLDFGGRIKYRNRLFQSTRAELNHLAEDTGFTSTLNLEENGELAIVHIEEGDRSPQLGLYPGMRNPMHSNAPGKAILANYSNQKINQFFQVQEFEQVTEFTKTNEDAIRDDLEAIHESGYAYDWDEQVVGMGLLAAPITVDERVLGSIALVCSSNQLSDDNQRVTLAERVKQSADIISVNYQYG